MLIKINVWVRTVLLIVGVGAFVVGCAPRETILDTAANGTQFETAQDQTFYIRLESNPTTGYRWEVIEIDEAVVIQVGDAVFETISPEDPPLPGAGGTETFQFDAIGPGETTLKLVYHRPWEDETPLDTFTLTVIVP